MLCGVQRKICDLAECEAMNCIIIYHVIVTFPYTFTLSPQTKRCFTNYLMWISEAKVS